MTPKQHPEINLIHTYRSRLQRKLWLLAGFSVLLIASVIFDISSGAGNLSLSEVLAVLLNATEAPSNLRLIVWDIRLPIALTAVLVGAMLAAAGAQMQTILSNPLADPLTLGISSAASLGAAIAMVYGEYWSLQSVATSLSAFVFALLATLLLLAFSRMRHATPQTLVLVGIAILFSCNALLSLIQYGANEAQLSQIVFWMMGSLGRSQWHSVAACTGVLILIWPLFIYRSWALTAMRMGDERASSLGYSVKRIRLEILVAVSLLTATAVSFVGTIGFVGLVAPHIARLLVGEEQRFFIPLAMLCGALLLSLTSIASKTISPGVVYPVGIITSLIGIPFFISLVLGAQKRSLS